MLKQSQPSTACGKTGATDAQNNSADLMCTAPNGIDLPVMAKIVLMHVKVLPYILRPAHGVQTPQVQATLCTLCLVLIKSQ